MKLIRQIVKRQCHRYLIILILTIGGMQTMLAQSLQEEKVTLNAQSQPLEKVIGTLTQQTGLKFFYNETTVAGKVVTLEYSNAAINTVLAAITRQTQLNFVRENNTITINTQAATSETTSQKGEPRRVTGTIIDSNGEPIIGVNVMEKGTNNGVITDVNGGFLLMVPDNATLLVSYMGYLSQEISVRNQTRIQPVVLKEDLQKLEEVVVVGYGTQKKVTVTGSIASTKGEKLSAVPTTNVTNTLVGRLPGLIAVSQKGEPGYDDATLLIRGKSTTGDATPLVVVDGVADRAGGFARIDPQDIESVTILKDASAAIYGSRAAKGVILITTKRGKEGKFQVNYAGNIGLSRPTVLPEMAESWQYATLVNEIETGIYERAPRYTNDQVQKFKDGSDPVNYPNTNTFKELMGTALQSQHNISLSGGSEKVRFFASLGYQYQDNYYKQNISNYNQYNLRSNIDISPHKNFSASFDLSARQEDRNSPRSTSDLIWRSLRVFYPTMNIEYPGTNYRVAKDGTNPLSASDGSMGYQKSTTNYYNGDITAHLNLPFITQGLSIDGGVYLDLTHYLYKDFYKQFFLYAKNGNEYIETAYGPNNASLTQQMNRSTGITLNGRINYERLFDRAHNVKVFAAYEQYTYRYDYLSGYRQNFISTQIDQLSAGDRNTATNDGTASEAARMNYFGRFDYDYVGKYLFQFNWRYDGSQNFPKGNRFGFFPGVSLGWRISEENFWKEHIPSVDNMKFRASWGKMGNDKVAQFQYLTSYTFENPAILGGANPAPQMSVWQTRTPNSNITWEVATSYNVGIDAHIVNGLNFTLDFFRSERNNILTARSASLPEFSGITLPDENFGECFSQGFEFVSDYTKQLFKGFKLNVGVNMSYTTNQIKNIDEPANIFDWQRRTGKSIDANWLIYESNGIFRTQDELDSYPHLSNARVGDLRFVDVDGDKNITGSDRVRLNKTDTPEIVYGITLGFDWGQWSLNSLWQGAGRVWLYQFYESGIIGNFTKDYFNNRWTPDNINAKYPRTYDLDVTPTGVRNSFWINNASYLRLKSVDLSYTLSPKLLKDTFIQNVRFYVSGFNLLTFTKLKDMDPESKSSYLYGEGADTPQVKVVSFGLNVTF
jgi:TonB-linked SusC/RagA family outer membrane protein